MVNYNFKNFKNFDKNNSIKLALIIKYIIYTFVITVTLVVQTLDLTINLYVSIVNVVVKHIINETFSMGKQKLQYAQTTVFMLSTSWKHFNIF